MCLAALRTVVCALDADGGSASPVGAQAGRRPRRSRRSSGGGRPARGGRDPRVVADRGPVVDHRAAAPAVLGGGYRLWARRGRLPRSAEREVVATALTI